MNPDQLETLFAEALDYEDPLERARFLDEACGADVALRQRAEKLVRAHEKAANFLSDPSRKSSESGPHQTMRLNVPLVEKPGDKIDHYKLLQQIGEGGCGVVYMAQQEEPVRRRVALKVIKLGMDTKQVIARFEAERQALALMDHPNIAKVLDAGATETGRPYFVMELVRGNKITEFCDENSISTQDRLKLFIQVCQAVQHAHQKGVIHRDIKPSNILVTINDGVPVPKVIDFGIAKATAGPLTDKTVFTAFDQFIGTPAYMSPEQAVMTSLDIDTRSDIYSLGVLLYELLVGCTPFDQKELLAVGLDEMRRTIREKEPPKPSTRLGAMMAEELTTTAKHRRIEAPKLIHVVRGDLDWIVMKCLEKERGRRYETANGVAADIQRHLDNEPVVARPPSNLYRLQKAVRRHTAALAAAIAIVTLLVSGVLVSTWQAVRATRAEREETVLRQRAQAAEETARRQETTALEHAAEARQQAEIARSQEILASRRFYAAQMNLAQQAWETRQPARALDLLETLRPAPGGMDLRRFEWFHLWALCNARLRLSFRASATDVNQVIFSADMKMLASAGEDGTARLWETTTGREVLRLTSGTRSGLSSVALTPDGGTLVAGSWDHRVLIWDLPSGKLGTTLTPNMGYIGYVAIAPQGGTLAFGGANGEVKLWNLSSNAELKSFKAGPHPVNWIVFSRDGSTLITSSGWSKDRLVKVWDLAGDASAPTLELPGTRAISLNSDGTKLATCPSRSITIWDTTSGQLISTITNRHMVFALAFLPNDRVVAGGVDRNITAWKFSATNDVMGEPEIIGTHLDAIRSFAVSADESMLASAGLDGRVSVWDVSVPMSVAEGGFASAYKVAKGMRTLAPLPDGKCAVISGQGGMEILDLTSGARHMVGSNDLGQIVLTPDGSRFASAPKDGIVRLWEVTTGRLIASEQAFPDEDVPAPALAIHPDGQTLAGGAFHGNAIKFWNITDGLKLNETVPVNGGGITSLSFSPRGDKLAVAVRFNEVAVVDLKSMKVERKFVVGNGDLDLLIVAFSPKGDLIATASESGVVAVWRAADGALHQQMQGQAGTIRSMAFAPDGDTLVTAVDTSVRLWDVATGQEKISFKRHRHSMARVTFTPDGKTLLTADLDGTIWLLGTPGFDQSDDGTIRIFPPR